MGNCQQKTFSIISSKTDILAKFGTKLIYLLFDDPCFIVYLPKHRDNQ